MGWIIMKLYTKPAIKEGLPDYMCGMDTVLVKVIENIRKCRKVKAAVSRGFVSQEEAIKIIEQDAKRVKRSPGWFTSGSGGNIITVLWVDHNNYGGRDK